MESVDNIQFSYLSKRKKNILKGIILLSTLISYSKFQVIRIVLQKLEYRTGKQTEK